MKGKKGIVSGWGALATPELTGRSEEVVTCLGMLELVHGHGHSGHHGDHCHHYHRSEDHSRILKYLHYLPHVSDNLQLSQEAHIQTF